MKVLVTGANGLVGRNLIPFLTTGGHEVVRLVRAQISNEVDSVGWNESTGIVATKALEGLDAVVHLAGENIADGRWTAAKKARIRSSRVEWTKLLSASLLKLPQPPKVVVCASAVGYYGDRGAEALDEGSMVGSGFLAELCNEWEEAATELKAHGIRVVHLRIGVVLSAAGGALAKMLPPFRMGLGGKMGNGEQYMSWVSIDDLIGIILHALTNSSLSGPVNAVSPNAVTNTQFTAVLGKVLHRPTIFPLPAFVARIILGEMVDELLLASARVEPRQLMATGYKFHHPELAGALHHLLGR